MSSITIVIPVYNQYELLRQCIESIMHTIIDEIEQIIIVDDYSDPSLKIKPYEKYIEAQSIVIGYEHKEQDKIKVIKSDEYRVSIHAKGRHLEIAQKRKDKELNGVITKKFTMGHSYALQVGVNNAITDYVMCCDADCVFLKNSKGMMAEIASIFEENEDVLCIGQLAGIMSNDKFIKAGEAFRYSMHGREIGFGGCPGSPAFFLRNDKNDSRPHILATKPIHRGWALSAFVTDIFNSGYSVMNYPVFSQKKIFHVGGGILNAARFYGEAGKEQARWGMLRDGCDYGGRRGLDCIADWYQGRYILDMDTRAYIKFLQEKYDKLFSEIQPPFDEYLLKVAKEEVRPVRSECIR